MNRRGLAPFDIQTLDFCEPEGFCVILLGSKVFEPLIARMGTDLNFAIGYRPDAPSGGLRKK